MDIILKTINTVVKDKDVMTLLIQVFMMHFIGHTLSGGQYPVFKTFLISFLEGHMKLKGDKLVGH